MINHQPMKKRTIFLAISIFLLILIALRIGWMNYHLPPEQPHAELGIIDLYDWEFTDNQTITLDGDWEFYPNKLLNPRESSDINNEFIYVPSDWQSSFADPRGVSTFGYGTYRLKVILPNNEQSLYGIRLKEVFTSAKIYIDGTLVSEFGEPGSTAESSKGSRGPHKAIFHTEDNEVEVLIHVSNFEVPFAGGITKSIMIGTEKAINNEAGNSITLQVAVSIVYLLHFIYAISLYFLAKGKHQREVLFYGIILAISCFTILIDDDVVLHLPLEIGTIYKIIFILFITTLMAWLTFIKWLFKITGRFYNYLLTYFILLMIAIITVPFDYFVYVNQFITLFYPFSIYFLFYHVIRKIRQGYPDGIFILLAVTAFSSNIVWGLAINAGLVDFPYYPFEFIITVIVIAFFLFKRHIRMVHLTEEQAEELQRADKMKDQFLANTSHELRNPLHGVINIAQSILHDKTEPLTKRTEENLQLLTRIGQQMSYTLNDLLDVTRLKDNHIQITKERVNIHSVATGVLDMLYYMTDKKDVHLRLEIPENFPDIYADKNRFIQILFNLVHNAIKFTNKGSVTVTVSHKRSTAYIHVIDTGIGIDDDKLHLIFRPYEQKDTDVNLGISGIGLGLSISKQLVELHGGNIMVDSAPNKGATFTFTLPLARKMERKIENEETAATIVPIKPTETKVEASLSQQHDDKPRILIVDDDPVNLRILKNILHLDYHVVPARNGREALKLIDKGKWDLVISDVMMPIMSGYELTKLIRKQFTISELPIILLTARQQSEDINIGFQVGANDYVSKPMDTLELQARVRALANLNQSIHEQLRLEAAWLQAQIQPHFLFNTLNTIASLSEIDSARMLKLLEHFGNYLQRSFDMRHTQSLISVKDELELVKSYLYIEIQRFGERLRVEWDVDDELDFQIPPLSIQPFVENAVKHGILKKLNGGKVSIAINKRESNYEIKICDDGVGIEKEKIEKLLSEQPDTLSGIGITNTNRRLKKMFGAGLRINSRIDCGTTIEFFIPK